MKRDPNDSERDYDTDNEPSDEGYERGESETGRTGSAEGEGGTSQRTRNKSTGRSNAGSGGTGGKGSGSTRGKRSTQRSSHRPSR